jgi:hypothetical protein
MLLKHPCYYKSLVLTRSNRINSILYSNRLEKSTISYKSSPYESYAFSGSGWLMPFHFGVIAEMKGKGFINPNTPVYGSSGGAIAALVVAADIDANYALEKVCLINKTLITSSEKVDLDELLKRVLTDMLKEHTKDAEGEMALLSRLNLHGNLNVCVTDMSRGSRRKYNIGTDHWQIPLIINQFEHLGDIISAIAASSFIPFYSHVDVAAHGLREKQDVLSSFSHAFYTMNKRKSLVTKIELHSNEGTHTSRSNDEEKRNRKRVKIPVVDGGLAAFMPPLGEITVSPFNPDLIPKSIQKQLFGFGTNSDRSPKICLPLAPELSLLNLMKWGASPPADGEALRTLFEYGVEQAKTYNTRNR